MQVLTAVLINARHPEYGAATIPLPITDEEHDNVMELLDALEIGDPVNRDCRVNSIISDYSVLQRLEDQEINIDELDYLAKRLESFDDGEAAQFQASASAMDISDMKDFINLTFCCQQATVIDDFRKLDEAGRSHFLNINGGCAPSDAFNKVDGRAVALELIRSGQGKVTPYGVFYDNGMKMEELYHGKVFPHYLHKQYLLALEMTKAENPQQDEYGACLLLPLSRNQIERTMLRMGIDTYDDMQLRVIDDRLPFEVGVMPNFQKENLGRINDLCRDISELSQSDRAKLGAVMLMVKPEYAFQVQALVRNLDLFEFVPQAETPEDYGRYMIQKSGHFEYDHNLDEFYDYEKYALSRMGQETGEFNIHGYVSYHGELSWDELMMEELQEQSGPQMGGTV